jgi:hypothetical protein
MPLGEVLYEAGSTLHSAGLIDYSGSRIQVLNREGLEKRTRVLALPVRTGPSRASLTSGRDLVLLAIR